MKQQRTAKEIRKKLDSLGIPVPRGSGLFYQRGDTFQLVTGSPEWVNNAVKVIRRAGYFVTPLQIESSDISILVLNLHGTEWQDGLIPEELYDLPLREPDGTQLTLFSDDE